MSSRDLDNRLRSSLEALLADSGVDLEDVTIRRAGKRRLVRALVDADGGVSLDTIAELTKAISAELDRTNIMGEAPYVLEVSSPGVERPLTLPRHWRRNVGRSVRIHFKDGREPVVARLLEVGDAQVILEDASGEVTIALDEVAKAIVQVDFKANTSDTETV